ncbi:MAG: flagellar biosynthetic protein FliR [Pyrinomonadaceae bacterium]|nr:flagellar biosynthetic protein FliR [Pyrinomonadaceae bacterium]
MDNFEVPIDTVLIFLVVLARAGGLVTFAPFWAHRSVSINIRVISAIVLSVALSPFLMNRIEAPDPNMYSLTLVLLGELLIGLLMGYVGRVIFTCFEMAAHFMGNQMGFSLAGIIDPDTRAQTTTFGIGAQMLSVVVLLAANGHHWFVIASVRSFEFVQPGNFHVSGELVDILLRMTASTLAVGLSLAAPAVIVLVVIEFGLEFFGRTAPQFQVFILGFPLKIGLGLTILGASVYFLPTAFRQVLGGIYTGLDQVIGTL